MITADAVKMLNNLNVHAVQGCLFGLSVWGSKAENILMGLMREAIEESGFELPNERSNFHLFGKVEGLAEKTGW